MKKAYEIFWQAVIIIAVIAAIEAFLWWGMAAPGWGCTRGGCGSIAGKYTVLFLALNGLIAYALIGWIYSVLRRGYDALPSQQVKIAQKAAEEKARVEAIMKRKAENERRMLAEHYYRSPKTGNWLHDRKFWKRVNGRWVRK